MFEPQAGKIKHVWPHVRFICLDSSSSLDRTPRPVGEGLGGRFVSALHMVALMLQQKCLPSPGNPSSNHDLIGYRTTSLQHHDQQLLVSQGLGAYSSMWIKAWMQPRMLDSRLAD